MSEISPSMTWNQKFDMDIVISAVKYLESIEEGEEMDESKLVLATNVNLDDYLGIEEDIGIQYYFRFTEGVCKSTTTWYSHLRRQWVISLGMIYRLQTMVVLLEPLVAS